MELKFLPLQGCHLDDVLEIEKASFPQPWTRGSFERELSLPISHFFVVELNGGIVGYSGYWQIEDEGHLINLAVRPDFRSRGFGRRILLYMLEDMASRGVQTVLLEVRESNLTARRLYESLGFAEVGIRPRYYTTENAVLMVKSLSIPSLRGS